MPEIGQTLSHFRLVEKIGQGDTGEVYLADDTTLDRKITLKFLGIQNRCCYSGICRGRTSCDGIPA